MTTPLDPYKAPQSSLDAPAVTDPSVTVPATVVQLLAQTRPWVRLVSILFFVALGLMVIGVVVVYVAMAGADRPFLATGAMVPVLFVMMLYAPPTVFLWQYAGSIRRLQQGGGLPALEEALARQKSFWKYVGVLVAVMLCFYAFAFLVTGLFGAALRR